MEDFDKLYADKMKRAGAPDFSEEDWTLLLPKLDAEHRRRWRALPLWWLGLLSGLLLCSNIGWWWMYQQSDKRMETLQQEWKQVRQQSVIQYDTVRTTVTVVRYDTIYRTLTYQSGFSTFSQPGVTMPNTGNSGGILASSSLARAQTTPAPTQKPDAIQPSAASGTTDLRVASNNSIPPDIQPFEVLPSRSTLLDIPQHRLHFSPLNPAPKAKRTPRPNPLTPKAFRLGAGGGFLAPVSNYLSQKSGYSTFLTGEVVFSDQLALTLDAAYAGIDFKGTVYDESLGIPAFPSPGDDYQLLHFETEEGLKPLLQLTTGMRYWFGARHRLSPYLGLGYGLQWHPGFELQAEFVNEITGKEKEKSVDVPFTSKPVSLLSFNAGVRYRFFSHWYWQTGAVYDFKTDPNQQSIPAFWGLRTSVLYGF